MTTQSERLVEVERRIDRMCTDSVLERWRWWRPSWSAGYHCGLTDAWRIAFDALMAELHERDEPAASSLRGDDHA